MTRLRLIPARAFELRFKTETVFVWNGLEDRKLHDENVYLGLRGAIKAPAIAFSGKAKNETGKFLIAGLPAEIEDLFWNEKEEVISRHLIERTVFLDEKLSFQDVQLTQIYRMTGVQSRREGGSAGGQPSYTLSVMVETLFCNRSEAGFGRYTQADQAGRYPDSGDKMMNMVSNLARGIKFQLQ
nr:hypothetical protein [uncultured Cohaesibacter sp.]